jgi:manganese transport protein
MIRALYLISTRRADVMGQFANGRLTTIAAMVATAVVLLLNVVLILQTLGVAIPGLSATARDLNSPTMRN